MSTLKVDTITTISGTGNINVSRPLSGSGASLTSLPAANLTGTLPALDGSNLTGVAPTQATIEALGIELPAANLTGTVADARISALTASKLTGALPAISGASLTGLPASGVTPKMKIAQSSYYFTNAPGTQTISGVGFAPDAMYADWGTGNSTSQGRCSFWAVNTSSSAIQSGSGGMVSWQHNEGQTPGTWEFKYNYAIWEKNYSNYVTATITTWGSDGITITYAKTGTPDNTGMNMGMVFFKLT